MWIFAADDCCLVLQLGGGQIERPLPTTGRIGLLSFVLLPGRPVYLVMLLFLCSAFVAIIIFRPWAI